MDPIIIDRCRLLALLPLLFASLLTSTLQAAETDDQWFGYLKVDQLERRFVDGSDVISWDAEGRLGNDTHKLTLGTEGEYDLDTDRAETTEWQLRYRRMISDFFDLHAGLRYDQRPRPDRTYAMLGISGLAPQWFEVDASLFLGEGGRSAARLEAEYDLLLTQRLVLQVAGELNVAFADDPAIGRGSGLNDLELGLRLRYQVTREFAPYVGINWERSYGETADLSVANGGKREQTALVAGVMLWF